MKVVLDTNVLLSGLTYPQGTPGRIVTAWREARFELVMSREQLSEIARVLSYRKIRRVLRWDRSAIERFLKQIYLRSTLVEIRGVEADVPRDPADSPILASLIVAEADYLVTGDADLLELKHRFAILTPAEFAGRM